MACHLLNHLLVVVGVLREANLGIFVKGKLLLSTSHLPLGVTNEGRESVMISRASSKFLAPLSGTPLYKIGELDPIFYLCFLVLLVYLSVFIFVSLTKNPK